MTPAVSVEANSTIDGPFSSINNQDVVLISDNPSIEEEGSWTPKDIPFNNLTDCYVPVRQNTNVGTDILTVASGNLDGVHNGTPMKYSLLPGYSYVNARTAVNTTSNVFTIISDAWPNWTRSFKTGDKVIAKSLKTPIYFNIPSVNISTNVVTVSTSTNFLNGQKVIIGADSELATLPVPLQSGQEAFVRVVSNATPGTVTLHPTSSDAINNTNAINFTRSGSGVGYLTIVDGLPTGLSDDQEYFIRITAATTFTLHTSQAGALANTNVVNITQVGSGFIRFEQILDGTEGFYAGDDPEYNFVQNSVNVDIANDIITLPEEHNLFTGDSVIYTSTTPIGGISNGVEYYVKVLSDVQVSLYTSRANALADTSKIDLTGTPVGSGKLTRNFGTYFTINTTQVNTAANQITFLENHPFSTGDPVIYYTRSGGITGVTSGQEYFVRSISDTTVSLHTTKQGSISNTNIVNMTGVTPGWGALKPVIQLEQGKVYYLRRTASTTFQLHRSAQEAVWNFNRIDIAREPERSDVGSGYGVFSMVKPWSSISMNNATTNIINTENSRNFKTGQQVTYRLLQGNVKNAGLNQNGKYFIRILSATTAALYTTYNDALRDVVANRVRILNLTGSGYLEGSNLPSGIGENTNTLVEKVGANFVKFKEDLISGRTIRILPTVGTRFLNISLSKRSPVSTSNTVFVLEHGLSENTPLIYNPVQNPAIPSLPQIGTNETFFVSSPTQNRFRISETNEFRVRSIVAGGSSIDLTGYSFISNSLGLLNRTVVQNTTNISTAANTIAITGHGFETGDAVSVFSTTEMPSPLIYGRRYYVRSENANLISLFNSKTDAINNTNRVNITSVGSGNLTLSKENFATGDSAVVSASFPITGLESGSMYYIGMINQNSFALFYTKEDSEGIIPNAFGQAAADLRVPVISFTAGTVLTLRQKSYIDFLEAGVGTQELSNVAQNAVDGIYSLDKILGGEGSTEFSLTPTEAILSPRSLTFNPYKDFSSETNAFRYEDHKLYNGAEIVYNESLRVEFLQNISIVNPEDNTLFIASHGLITGQEVKYAVEEGSKEITGLENGRFYFVIAEDEDRIKLALTQEDADNDIAVNFSRSDGGLDLEFSSLNILGDVSSVKYISDKIYIAGEINAINGVNIGNIIRLNENGTVDESFVCPTMNGKVRNIFVTEEYLYAVGEFRSVGGQPYPGIVKLTNDGDVDQFFAPGEGFNTTLINDVVEYEDENEDKKIVAIGSFSEYDENTSVNIVRINDDGSYDETFNVGSGLNGTPYEIAIDSSKEYLYVVGAFTQYKGSSSYSNKIVKINSEDGSVNTDFIENSGIPASENIFSVFVAPATDDLPEQVIIGGDFTEYDGENVSQILALNTDGTLATFVYENPGANEGGSVLSVVAQKERVIGVGNFSSWNEEAASGIIVLDRGGEVDSNFISGTGFNGIASDVDFNNEDFSGSSLFVVGSFSQYNGISANNIAKLDSLEEPFFGTGIIFVTSTVDPITNLDNNREYYVIRTSKDWFQIALSRTDAELGIAIDVGGDLSNGGTLGDDQNHSFSTYNIGAEVVGPGTVTTSLGSNIIQGTDTNFLNLFKNGDIFKIFVVQPDVVRTIAQANTATNRQISVTQNTTNFNVTSDVITTPTHSYLTGDFVVYTSSTPAGGLSSGQGYYVRVLTATTITLHPTKEDAVANTSRVDITSAPTGTAVFTQANQFFSVNHGFLNGQTVVYSSTNAVIGLTNENIYYVNKISNNAFALTQHFDLAVISNGSITGSEETLVTSTGNALISTKYTGAVFQSRVSGIKSETGIIIDDPIPALASDERTPIGNLSLSSYALVTSLFVKADGFALHRPFDGGVELTPSLNPDSSVVRQTRKYFRYQSGKGLQISFGINFNAPTQIDQYSVNNNTGVATIKTRYANRVTENLQISIFDSQDFQLGSPRTFVQNSSSIDTEENTITFIGQQEFVDGQKVQYFSFNPINVLENEDFYYVAAKNRNTFPGVYEIYKTMQGALSRNEEDLVIFENLVPSNSIGQLIPQNSWTGTYFVQNVIDDKTFEILLDGIPPSNVAQGFSQYVPTTWDNSLLRCGFFDDQNGMFFEFDGKDLKAVRRSSVEQLSGTATATFNSGTIIGQNTAFSTQISKNDYIVVRGQSYKVVNVASNNILSIQPAYRGVTRSGLIITKTVDTKVPQSQWSLDKADGKGPSGFNLDLTKMQMAYIDYSWYGAGKIRFGFKGTFGDVVYFHEFVHNNQFTEAYMRSGNLPARYEVLNLSSPTYSPVIAHWGTSVIMDGGFQEDGAYLFTADGQTISYTNVLDQEVFSGTITSLNSIGTVTDPETGEGVPGYRINAASWEAVRNLRPGTPISGPITGAVLNVLPNGTLITNVFRSGSQGIIYINKLPTALVTVAANFAVGPSSDVIPKTLPLVSVRLGPSVDNSLVGVLGSREVINRMQLNLKNIGILTTHDVEIKLILNGNIDNLDFENITKPSLSQVLRHRKGDIISGGVPVYTFRVPGASNATASISNSVELEIDELLELGNSIQGGDGIFPDGPDLLTIAASVLDTSLIGTATPFRIAGRISWAESQA
jgi:hypothetical protein